MSIFSDPNDYDADLDDADIDDIATLIADAIEKQREIDEFLDNLDGGDTS